MSMFPHNPYFPVNRFLKHFYNWPIDSNRKRSIRSSRVLISTPIRSINLFDDRRLFTEQSEKIRQILYKFLMRKIKQRSPVIARNEQHQHMFILVRGNHMGHLVHGFFHVFADEW